MIQLVGTNPRVEAPVLNARIRKRWLAGGCRIGSVGAVPDAIYTVTTLGDGPQALADLGEFKQVLAGNGPCNRERLAARRKAHEEGAWVREAAAAHAAKRRQKAAA